MIGRICQYDILINNLLIILIENIKKICICLSNYVYLQTNIAILN